MNELKRVARWCTAECDSVEDQSQQLGWHRARGIPWCRLGFGVPASAGPRLCPRHVRL